MAVLGRLLVSSAERIDLPDFISIDSYSAGDWKYFMDTLVGEDTPYIIKGFDILNPANAIGTQSCSVNIAESAMYFPGSGAGSFFYGFPVGDPNAVPLVPELIKNATNYVYLTLTTSNTSEDTRAFWDPNANGGVGDEFTQEVNTESVLQVQVNVSTASFPDNTVPVAIIVVGSSVITSIEDARPMMFRLGSGGVSPNPNSRFAWPALPNSSFERLENTNTITSPSGLNPFEGGDKNLMSLKNWMDAVMSKLAELGGTQFWYESTASFSVTNVFHDALATTFKSKGEYIHSPTTPGNLQYTEDVLILSASDPREYIIRAGTIQIPDEDVAYLDLIRAQPINTLDAAVSWVSGQPYVNTPNGSIGFFANLSQGDWIKKVGDDPTLFLRVEQFYDTINLGGSVTTAALAKSIRLSANYQGSTANDIARYDHGVYLSTDIQIQARTNVDISDAGGNFFWFAVRSDTVEGIASISSVTLSGTVFEANGSVAGCSVTAHGLNNGDYITVTAPAPQAGTYAVEVADANTFYFNTTNTTTGALTAFYGLLTTAATTNGYGLQLESADHGFETGETIQITNTTAWNGAYPVSFRSSTQVQIPVGSALTTETSGNATLARLDVRTEEGITKVVQGETIDIGEGDSKNIQQYVGMASLAETSPSYFTPVDYNTIEGFNNYNSTPTDSLTQRAANLTAMMADKAQDKTVKYLTNASTVNNTTAGAAQQITFAPSGSQLTILEPGSPGNAVIALPSVSPGISLLINQSAYVVIDRNNASSPSIVVANNSLIPVDENVFVIASRLSDTNIYIWNGSQVNGSSPIVPGGSALLKVNFFDPVSVTLPIGNPVTEDGISVQAGNLVLFSNLSSNNNSVYMANGTGTNITSWTIQPVFNGISTPTVADTVIVEQGNAFANQVGEFNGTTWQFNAVVRYFNTSGGTINYSEQDALATSTLNDNTVNGTVFTVGYVGSEYMIVDFSLNRGISRETGTLYVTSDGTNVDVATDSAYISDTGTTFSGTITGSSPNQVLNILYTTTSTGDSVTMKYTVRRWADGPGGPAGPPSYTGFTGSTVAAAGPNQAIQYNNGGTIAGNANFLVDVANQVINLNGLKQSVLSGPVTILDNQAAPVTLFTYNAAASPYALFEYSVVRNGNFRIGRFLLANDGTITSDSDDFVETNPTGITLMSNVVGANVEVQYTSTSTGFGGTFKYSSRQWS